MDERQNNSPDAMLGALLSNPDLLRRVGSILGNAAKNNEKATDGVQKEAELTASVPTVSSGGLPTADGLAAVLSNPEMMEKLPSVIATLAPMLGSIQPQKPHEVSSPSGCRDQLLLALKPFLSPSRRDAVDQILRLARLGTVFGQLK